MEKRKGQRDTDRDALLLPTNRLEGSVVANVTLHGFRLTETELVADGEPTFEQWQQMGHVLMWMLGGTHWWVVDWVAHGEGHYGERFSQALDVTGWKERTLQQYLWVGRHVPVENRGKLPIGHYITLATLGPPVQRHWIAWCEEEQDRTGNLPSQRDLRHEIRRAEREPTATSRVELSGTYRVIYADPPWSYARTVSPSGSSPTWHYPNMTIDEIAKLPVKDHARRDAVLCLWCPEPLRFDVQPVIDGWGFTHKTAWTWDKIEHNFGHYLSVRHEHLLICVRGSCTPDRLTPMIDSVQTIRRSDVHSEKPKAFRTHIERLYDGPYLELFGRRPVDGWTVYGNQFDARVTNATTDTQIVAGNL